jgi:serine/threonine protein kinase
MDDSVTLLADAIPQRPSDLLLTDSLDQFGRPRCRPSVNDPDKELICGWVFPGQPGAGETVAALGLEAQSGSLITIAGRSPIFRILDFGGEWSIKYITGCDSGETHPALIEAFFMGVLDRESQEQISPKFLYYSQTVPLESIYSKFPPPIDEIRRLCLEQPVTVRYIIHERVRGTLGDLIRSNLFIPFQQALDLGRDMIGLVRNLHALNIVHGRISPDTFSYDSHTRRVLLLNFERARKIHNGDPIIRGEQIRLGSPPFDPFESPWEMSRDLPYRFRDDVYRVMLCLASLVHGQKFISILTRLRPLESHSFKMYGNIFHAHFVTLETELNVTRELQKAHVSFLAIVRALLEDLVDSVRRTPIRDKPDYGDLLLQLDAIEYPGYS